MKTLIFGASGELGGAIAKCLDKSGHSLSLHRNSNKAALDRLADELDEHNVCECDVTDEKAVELAVADSVDAMGGLDAFVYAVGVNPTAALVADTSTQHWSEALAINLTGAFFATRAALPHLRSSEEQASIVFVSSVFGINAPRNRGAYSVSKHGLTGLVQSLAKEEAPKVRVNGVCPGAMWTDNVRHIFSEHAQSVGISVEEYVKERASQVPFGRFLELEECASLVDFLLSNTSRFVTGEMIRIGGGEV